MKNCLKYLLGSIIIVASCSTNTAVAPDASDQNDPLLQYLLQGRSSADQASLQDRISSAQKFHLGSSENPVRADKPRGQIAYLSRLRCENGVAPTFRRVGNDGPGVYGSIIDSYLLDCANSKPSETIVKMDMYHPGYVENEPIEGFKLLGGNKSSD